MWVVNCDVVNLDERFTEEVLLEFLKSFLYIFAFISIDPYPSKIIDPIRLQIKISFEFIASVTFSIVFFVFKKFGI